MKLIALLFALTLTTVAHAESFDIFEAQYNGRTPSVTVEFAANKQLGRAWVEINVDNSDADSSLGNDDYRTKVEGLSYDAATKSIMLERDGQLIECAKWKNGGFFGLDGFKPTGCKFSHRLIKKTIDDGFDNYTVRAVVVTITTL